MSLGRLSIVITLTGVVAAPVAAQGAAPSDTQAGDIVVTATGFEQTVAHAPATITVIDGETINNRAYQSVADALRDVPGVTISGGGTAFGRSGNMSISIRGLTDSYVLFMVDGRPVGNSPEASYDGFGTGINGSFLPPPSTIERIEVIRGPMSSLYGSSALGGVINIITKSVSDVWSGSVNTGLTLYEKDHEGTSYEGRFNLSGPLIGNRLGLTIYGSIGERSDHELADGSVQDIYRDSIGGKLSLAIADNQRAALEVVRVTQNNESTGRGGGFDMENMNYSLSHRIDWSPGFETTSFVSYEDDTFLRTDLPSGYSQLNANTRTRTQFSRHELTLGADYRWEETRHAPSRVPADIDPTMTRWNAALFGEANLRLLDNLTATLGARYDENERYGSHFTPRAYAVLDVTPTLVLKGGVSGGFKVPQLKQADDAIIETAAQGRGWDQGNTNLKPETSTNYEIGALWNGGSGIQLGVTAYHTQFTNRIDRDRICEDPEGRTCLGREYIAQYVNRAKSELTGVEATFRAKIQTVTFSANYTYSESKNTQGTGAGTRFNSLPEHVGNINIDWKATDVISLWTRAQYRSASYDVGTQNIPEHVVIDLGSAFRIDEHVQANFGVYNLGNRVFAGNDFLDSRRYYVSLSGRF